MKEQEKIAQESGYKIEFVGWEKSIRRQCDLVKKTSISVDNHDITHIDKNSLEELRKTVPEGEVFDLSRNLITSLDTFHHFHILGDTLKEINFSHNPLNTLNFETISALFDKSKGFNRTTFPNLEKLFLNNTKSESFNPWQFVYMLGVNGCLPKLGELQICVNNLKTLKLPQGVVNNVCQFRIYL